MAPALGSALFAPRLLYNASLKALRDPRFPQRKLETALHAHYAPTCTPLPALSAQERAAVEEAVHVCDAHTTSVSGTEALSIDALLLRYQAAVCTILLRDMQRAQRLLEQLARELRPPRCKRDGSTPKQPADHAELNICG
ncbi:hypothetical protein MVES_002541 [Malassezia vespertilionis]|uniref:Uncharacterized protein n=1 Tax=Malassezia vespertilionis TaxID=2020962 RepID=A0A2N1JAG1_9BASI|nr:hypothetical protein MVES_002541 [Malassezia vespertilionis]